MSELIKENKVKEAAKNIEMSVSKETIPELDKKIRSIIVEAAYRAKTNKRKTIMKHDL